MGDWTGISEILEKVAKAAGIGGIALGVFLVLFREVIRKSIFPMMTKDQSYRFLRILIILVWSVAVIGVVAWIYIETRPKPEFEPGRGEVTDIQVLHDKATHTSTVDFRVVNRGNRPIAINQVRLRVIDVSGGQTAGALNFSAKYDLDISALTKAGDEAEVSVSHALLPGEVDRFGVVLTAQHMGMGWIRTWRLQPTLMTTEGKIDSGPIEVTLP